VYLQLEGKELTELNKLKSDLQAVKSISSKAAAADRMGADSSIFGGRQGFRVWPLPLWTCSRHWVVWLAGLLTAGSVVYVGSIDCTNCVP
jgi:hypothetical protein